MSDDIFAALSLAQCSGLKGPIVLSVAWKTDGKENRRYRSLAQYSTLRGFAASALLMTSSLWWLMLGNTAVWCTSLSQFTDFITLLHLCLCCIRSALSLSSCTKTCDVFFINHSPNYKSVSLLYQGVNTSYLGLIVLLVTLWRHFYKPRLIIQSLHPEWVQRRTRLKEGRPAGTNVIFSPYVIQLHDNHHLRVTANFK